MNFLLGRVFGYRRKVMLDNLSKCFPGADEPTLRKMLRSAYRNLTDILIEGIKAFTMTKKQIIRRHRILNPEIAKPYFDKGQSLIGVTGHYGNWEWGSISASLQMDHSINAFYKPLSNKWVDRFVRRSRSKSGTTLVSIYETAAVFERFKNEPAIYLMAADQSPTNRERSYWVNFLGRDTAFLHGPEKYSRTYNYPVFYIDIRRIKRGFYEIRLSLLAEDPAALPEGELTARYAKKLESVILDDPANWLWSHRRWKMKR